MAFLKFEKGNEIKFVIFSVSNYILKNLIFLQNATEFKVRNCLTGLL